VLPRHKLPQIPSDKLDEFVNFLRENGINAALRRLPIIKLKPIQQHVNRSKVEALKEKQDALSIPLIVSETGYILDGHHRWIARKELNPDESVNTIWCECPLRKLIELGHAFEPSFTKTVHERRIFLHNLV